MSNNKGCKGCKCNDNNICVLFKNTIELCPCRICLIKIVCLTICDEFLEFYQANRDIQ